MLYARCLEALELSAMSCEDARAIYDGIIPISFEMADAPALRGVPAREDGCGMTAYAVRSGRRSLLVDDALAGFMGLEEQDLYELAAGNARHANEDGGRRDG